MGDKTLELSKARIKYNLEEKQWYTTPEINFSGDLIESLL